MYLTIKFLTKLHNRYLNYPFKKIKNSQALCGTLNMTT